MPWIAAAIAAGASLAGGIMDRNSAKAANEANINLSVDQRNWLEMMSNTAHQREVQDLRNAGLNPILSTRLGGASTPVPAVAHVEPVKSLGSAFSGAVGAGASAYAQAANIEQTQAITANTNQNTMKASAETTNITADTQLKDAQRSEVQQRMELAGKAFPSTLEKTQSETANIKEHTRNLTIDYLGKEYGLDAKRVDQLKAMTDDEFYSSPEGRIARLIELGGRSLEPATSAVGNLIPNLLRMRHAPGQGSSGKSVGNYDLRTGEDLTPHRRP